MLNRIFRLSSSYGFVYFSTSLRRSCKDVTVNRRVIHKLLIANRGEIACRIIRTARRLGIKTVAVYSEADAHSLHVASADEAYCVGKPPSQESYLRMDKIMQVAKTANAQAIHPGYGFLSENTEFAELCAREGVIFVGPPANAIRDMGIKNKAKAIMEAAGVPVIKGYHGDDQSAEKLREECDRIGYPVMLKAVRGGGGKGMRIAMNAGEFQSQLDSAKREAMKSFGNDHMIVEKYVENPRHVEVQVFGDQHGGYVYLWERDCSVQRRHQKVIEEAPAPGLTEQTRRAIGEAAVKAAAAVNYCGAGTVEFIMDPNQKFYFMEMNTRLQVEHPVTEMITGQDLVEWQLMVAQGQQLPLSQDELPLDGHAFEARIYAEDPTNNFMPGAGNLAHLSPPAGAPFMRVETGVRQGDDVSVYYDPMIAKLVVWGPDRIAAIERLNSALSEYHIVGLQTNVAFLRSLLMHPQFREGNVNTNFIPDYQKDLFPALPTPSNKVLCHLVAGCLLQEAADTFRKPGYNPADPFSSMDSFRVNSRHTRVIKFLQGKEAQPVSVTVTYEPNGVYSIICPDGMRHRMEFDLDGSEPAEKADAFEFSCVVDGVQSRSKMVTLKSTAMSEYHLFNEGASYVFQAPEPAWVKATGGIASAAGGLVAPMPGVIEKILVQPGQSVKQNEPLLVMIAMKMEYVIKAPKDGTVDKLLCRVGDNVPKNMQLVALH